MGNWDAAIRAWQAGRAFAWLPMPTPHPMKCPTKKKCFRTLDEAQPYLESLKASEHPVRAAMLATYRCPHCQWLHIGHSGPVRRRGRWAADPNGR